MRKMGNPSRLRGFAGFVEPKLMDLVTEFVASGNEQDCQELKGFLKDRLNKRKICAVDALPVLEKPNENCLAEILFVIDQSGSMGGEETEKAVVANFNKVIAQQRAEEGDAVVSTVLFNTQMVTMYESQPIAEVKELERRNYTPAGGTALLDAVGASIERICKRQAALPDAERPGTTIVVIITDGEENSSRTYTQPIVKRMIQTLQEKHGWDFLYFGANVDHFAEAHNLGIDVEDSLSFDACEDGINLCMAECNHRVSYRRARKRLTGRV